MSSPGSPLDAEPASLSEHGDVALTVTGKPHKRPSKIACLGCRTIKVKCRLPNGEIPTGQWDKDQSKCSRCIRLRLPCEYKSAPRRGRKPKDRSSLAPGSTSGSVPPPSLGADATTSGEPLAQLDVNEATPMYNLPPSSGVAADPTAPAYSLTPGLGTIASTSTAPMPPPWPVPSPNANRSPHLAFAQHSPYSASALQLPIPLQPPAWPPARAISSATHSSPVQGAGSHTSPGSGTGSLIENSNTMLSLAEAADVRSSSFTTQRPSLLSAAAKGKKASPKMPDPVDLHVLSALEASQLFQLFHSQLNPYIILFDRHLHTPEYVRSTSTVLFTAILAASAKFFRPDLHAQLLLTAQQLVTRSMGGDGEPHIGLVQSLLILTYWKEPLDTSSWLKVGYAIRLGYQLGLHQKRYTALPANEHEARIVLDRERTWIVLICFDNSYMLSEEDAPGVDTHMITQWDVDIDSWLDETKPYDVPDDHEQVISISLIKIFRLYPNVARAPTKAVASTLATHLSFLLGETHRKYLDPASHKARFHWCDARLSLAQACLTAAGVDDARVLADYMARCEDFVMCFEEAVAESILRYMQDSYAIKAFAAGEYFGKLFPRVHKTIQASIISWITRIYVASSKAKEGNDNSAAAFLSRFYKAILHALHPGGVPPTRPASPRAGASTGFTPGGTASSFGSVNPFESLGGMENEIFGDFDTLVADLSRDNTYWYGFLETNSSWAWLDQALLQPPPGNVAGGA
ncbi:hypothetical protein Rhopal_001017-T1 [Rhodotorula paludigena]|uniref:Zn(2)-C6 fungal-type domain-containing protein n=1 Tax=Rhodotorula paludigena TaxID=86838 RepID=A0AAV5GEJ7_9BASI|nr:hypothetical protein Rhopal_001017-T1 [Rhodotorula paludigena]